MWHGALRRMLCPRAASQGTLLSSGPPNWRLAASAHARLAHGGGGGGGETRPHVGPPQPGKLALPGIRHLVAVASGKGGVGKTSLAVNLAVALAGEQYWGDDDGGDTSGSGTTEMETTMTQRRRRLRVGLLDCDVFGPSVPRMMGLSGLSASSESLPSNAAGGSKPRILPMEAHGVACMSMGFLVPESGAVVWRGPMVMGAVRDLLGNTAWPPLDVLLLDLPPGTGDVQLTLVQRFTLTGAVVVSTPQDVALADVTRGIDMFRKTKVPVLGLVENMSHHACGGCGRVSHVFGHGGVRRMAEATGVNFLGEVPLHEDVCVGGERGAPVVLSDPTGIGGSAYREVALQLRRVLADM